MSDMYVDRKLPDEVRNPNDLELWGMHFFLNNNKIIA